MSLLTICQNVAKEVPLSVPSQIVGNSDETAGLILACAQSAGKSLARRRNKNGGWVDMIKEHTFVTVADQADYDFPSDYSRVLTDSLWDRANYWEMRGPLSPSQWQTYKSSVLGSSVALRRRFRIRDVSGTRKFSIDPTPATADETLVFEYVSKNWCESSGGTGQSAWAADADVGIIDEWLLELETKWRVLNRLGMMYQEEKSEAENEIAQALAADGGSGVLSITPSPSMHLLDNGNIPDTGYGS